LLNMKDLEKVFGRDPLKLFVPWYYLVKFVLPAVILLVFVMQLFK
ncbi:sodium-dependent transporter, partial [Staphylococcus epidermidis]|nr:sodium-dependent transporter [Staphylococcus epidermidis]